MEGIADPNGPEAAVVELLLQKDQDHRIENEALNSVDSKCIVDKYITSIITIRE